MCSWVSQVPRPGPPGHSPSTMGLPGWAGRRRWGRLGSAEDICPCLQPCDGSAFTVLAELRRCGLTDSETCLRSLTLSLAGGQTVSADPGARGGAASLMQVTTARALTLVWAVSTRHGLRALPTPFAACTSVGPLHDRFRARGGVSAPAPAHSPCLTKTLGCAWAQGTHPQPILVGATHGEDSQTHPRAAGAVEGGQGPSPDPIAWGDHTPCLLLPGHRDQGQWGGIREPDLHPAAHLGR